MTKLKIRQQALSGKYKFQIRLTLSRQDQADLEGEAEIEFTLTESEQNDLRWYLEDDLQRPEAVEAIQVEQVEAMMKARGEELYNIILDGNQNTRAIWFRPIKLKTEFVILVQRFEIQLSFAFQ